MSLVADGLQRIRTSDSIDPVRQGPEARKKAANRYHVFPGRFGGHKSINKHRALQAAFEHAELDLSSRNLRKIFAIRLLSRGAAITNVQHLLGHASVKMTERAYAAFIGNERCKQTIDLLGEGTQTELTVV